MKRREEGTGSTELSYDLHTHALVLSKTNLGGKGLFYLTVQGMSSVRNHEGVLACFHGLLNLLLWSGTSPGMVLLTSIMNQGNVSQTHKRSKREGPTSINMITVSLWKYQVPLNKISWDVIWGWICKTGTREKTQRLRVFAALPENQVSFPRTHMAGQKHL